MSSSKLKGTFEIIAIYFLNFSKSDDCEFR